MGPLSPGPALVVMVAWTLTVFAAAAWRLCGATSCEARRTRNAAHLLALVRNRRSTLPVGRRWTIRQYHTPIEEVPNGDDTSDVGGRATASAHDAERDVEVDGAPAIPPTRATWARVAGPGSQSLTWSVKQGRWAVVVMRPDGLRGVSADLAAGAKLPALLWASIVLLVFGILILGGAASLIYFVGGREPRVPATPAA